MKMTLGSLFGPLYIALTLKAMITHLYLPSGVYSLVRPPPSKMHLLSSTSSLMWWYTSEPLWLKGLSSWSFVFLLENNVEQPRCGH